MKSEVSCGPNYRRSGKGLVNSISLIIINDDAADYLAGLFDSLHKQEGIEKAEIIFIDNASSDRSVAAAKKTGIDKIYSFKKKVPVPRLYNKGLEMAVSPSVIFAHSDIVLREGFFHAVHDYLRDPDRAPSFINFIQYYVDHNRFGCNYVSFTISDGSYYYRNYFDWDHAGTAELVPCSEGCFMITMDIRKDKPSFNEEYQSSLFEYDFITINKYKTVCVDGGYYHYFIEAHEKLPKYEEDRALFIERCWPILEPVMRKKRILVKIKIAIDALVDSIFPAGSLQRKALSRILSLFK